MGYNVHCVGDNLAVDGYDSKSGNQPEHMLLATWDLKTVVSIQANIWQDAIA
jgi:hypothetical protein